MQLRNAIEKIPGFRFMMEKLEVCSALARESLYATPYLCSGEALRSEWDQVEAVMNILRKPENREAVAAMRNRLTQVKNIRGTAMRLNEGQPLDDMELFEVKAFSLLTVETGALMEKAAIGFLALPNLEPVVELLDPEKTRVPHFYIYHQYDPELKGLRNRLKALSPTAEEDKEEWEALYHESLQREDEVRRQLSQKLHAHGHEITEALFVVSRLDILLAKASQAMDMHLVKPVIASCTRYSALVNPLLQEILHAEGKAFQPVDLSLTAGATLITGANMAGKTVLLKTAALAQTLCQFGFYVPATTAEIALVDEVILRTGDEQDETRGLSSFAAEMVELDRILQTVKTGKKLLLLLDEPARTTNPTEGKAIVSALLELLTEYKVSSLITSHYSGIGAACRKWRVKGFTGQPNQTITMHNINQYIDYTLMEETDEEVPHEALRIAGILGVDEELLKIASRYL